MDNKNVSAPSGKIEQTWRTLLSPVTDDLAPVRDPTRANMVDLDPKFLDYLRWAFSRHLTFHECRRAYWFDYVATYDREVDSLLKNRIWKLRDLTSKRFLAGSLVHNAIAEFLSNLSKGREMTENELHDHLLQNIERYRRTARDTLAEYFNGLALEQTYFDRVRTEGTEQLSMFLRVMWPPLSRLGYTQHEKPERFEIDDIPVTVKIDLVSKSPDGRIFVIDWKTGGDDERYQSDLQIGVYALWAAWKFGVDPATVVTDLYYLRSGKTVSKHLTSEDFDRIRQTVATEYQEFTTATSKDENPANPAPDRCLGCKFATVCEAADLTGAR